MKIISKGPVKVRSVKEFSNACGCSGIDGYSDLDGGSPQNEISDFQAFALAKGAKNVSGTKTGKPLKVDGIWGENTDFAYNVYGKDWEASKLDQGKPHSNDDKPAPKKDNPKAKLMDKWKALSTTKKGIVIGGASLLSIGIVILIWKLIPKK